MINTRLVELPLDSSRKLAVGQWSGLSGGTKIVTKMWRLKRWWYLSKLLTITITSFIFVAFSAALQNCKRIWSWNFDRNLIMAIYATAWKSLYNFKIKRSQEGRFLTNFSFNFQNNENFEIFKLFKNNSWIYVY